MAPYLTNKRIFIVISAVLLAVAVISISRPAAYKKKTEPVADRINLEEEGISSRKLIPANPVDYGMVVFEKQGPADEAGLDAVIRKKMQEIKSGFPEEVLNKARKIIEEDPQKTKEKLAKIEEAIAECRQALKENPSNEEAGKRLSNLLILKSIAKELP